MQTAPRETIAVARKGRQLHAKSLLLSIGAYSLEHIEDLAVNLLFFDALRGQKMQTASRETVIIAIGAYSIERIGEMSKLPRREPLLFFVVVGSVGDWGAMTLRGRELQNEPK